MEALNRAAPCLALALLAFSLLCAVGYSRYLARPIVRISSIAGRMAELDFQWKCGETRRDEIGALGRSLDEMAERLSAALAELEEANAACGATWSGPGSWNASGWPSSPPPPTS
ncbi:HAMP domain-containing protein [Flavonifractor plautii]|nr:HAMP domain-containing protein [Flavonifractor plautii]